MYIYYNYCLNAIDNNTYVNYKAENINIWSYNGIKYMKFVAEYGKLEDLPQLPNLLEILKCPDCKLTHLPILPDNLIDFSCYENKIISLPQLSKKIKILCCCGNNLIKLPETLPDSLIELWCSYNKLTNLSALPSNLIKLICCGNNLTNLPQLPNLLYFMCLNNKLNKLPKIKITNLLNVIFDRYEDSEEYNIYDNININLIKFISEYNFNSQQSILIPIYKDTKLII